MSPERNIIYTKTSFSSFFTPPEIQRVVQTEKNEDKCVVRKTIVSYCPPAIQIFSENSWTSEGKTSENISLQDSVCLNKIQSHKSILPTLQEVIKLEVKMNISRSGFKQNINDSQE